MAPADTGNEITVGGKNMRYKELDYDNYVEIADGIYWVGFADEHAGFHCNPYLIVDDGEAVLIDSGSRHDFGTVMLKIMRTGTDPRNIKRLIYQHYDPDLCGNLPHMESLINSNELKVLSHQENNIFINHFSAKTEKECIEELGFSYSFTSGRKLMFMRTPYSHSAGSFVTYDIKTKVLFSSDLFGSYDSYWELYSSILDECDGCSPKNDCPLTEKPCEITGILDFHRSVMTSTKALRLSLAQISELDISIIAPQHGSLLHTPMIQKIVKERLCALDGVGIDRFLGESCK